jgi:hypothetical protein
MSAYFTPRGGTIVLFTSACAARRFALPRSLYWAMISPGVEFTYVLDNPNNKAIKVYADVEVPVYQRVNGNQLTSPRLCSR